jgi:hypothetical protein
MVHLPHTPSQAISNFESYHDRRQFLSTAAVGIVSASAASLLSARRAPGAVVVFVHSGSTFSTRSLLACVIA